MKILLLNPPGERLSIRDLYCAITSKARYYWEPADLVILSGVLAQSHEVRVLDAMVERLSAASALRRLEGFRPDVVISLTGSATWPEDFVFFRRIKLALPGTRIVVSGDIVIGKAAEILQGHADIDACLLDFTSPSILRYLEEPDAREPLARLAFRRNGQVVLPGPDVEAADHFRVPLPRHDLFPLDRYRLPYASGPVATVLGGFGCPFTCSFCIQSSRVMNFKHRPVSDIMAELRTLRGLGIKHVLFRDPTFEASKKEALALCELLTSERLGLTWSCNSRVDTLNDGLLGKMSAAGCRMILMGFETASDRTLDGVDKHTTQRQADQAVLLCRRHGIRVSGYFILGLPLERREDALKTISRAIELDLDYVSFAAPSPDYGTPLRALALAQGWAGEKLGVFDRSNGTMFDGLLSPAETEKLLRLGYRRFYLRPRWLWGQLARIQSLRHLSDLCSNGLELARRLARGSLCRAGMS